MEDFKILFGKRVKKFRQINKFSQEELAEKIGIAVTNMGKIERGESFVTSSTLEKLCTALNVKVKDLFDFETYKSVQEIKNEINLDALNDKSLYIIYKLYKMLVENY